MLKVQMKHQSLVQRIQNLEKLLIWLTIQSFENKQIAGSQNKRLEEGKNI